MRFKYLTAMLLAIIFFSCGTNKDIEVSAVEVDIPEEKAPPKIVFLYFDIEKKSDGIDKISLTETQVVDGQMKENTIQNEPKKDGNLILQIIGNNDSVLEEQVIENPLNQNIEQYSEEGEMNSENVKLEKSQFYMRFNKQQHSKSIKILKVNAKQNIELFNQKLNL